MALPNKPYFGVAQVIIVDALQRSGWVLLTDNRDVVVDGNLFCVVYNDGTVEFSDDGWQADRADGNDWSVALGIREVK